MYIRICGQHSILISSVWLLKHISSSYSPLRILSDINMPRRSNRGFARGAVATSAEWECLIAAAEPRDGHHHVKVVCLDEGPATTSTVNLLCFSSGNVPLGIGLFKCEDGLEHVLPRLSPAAEVHPVFEVVFVESTRESDRHQGIIMGMKDPGQGVPHDKLVLLMSHFGDDRMHGL